MGRVRVSRAEDRRQAIESPCTRVCRIDRQRGLCEGCLRSLDEIARWTRMADDERQRVMADLAARKSAQDTRQPSGA